MQRLSVEILSSLVMLIVGLMFWLLTLLGSENIPQHARVSHELLGRAQQRQRASECLPIPDRRFCSCDYSVRAEAQFPELLGNTMFTERLKPEFIGELSQEDTVLEIGGNTGRDLRHFITSGAGRVLTLVPMLVNQAVLRLIARKSRAAITILPFGAGGTTRSATVFRGTSSPHANEATSLFNNEEQQHAVQVPVRDIVDIFDENNLTAVSLLSINCEGCEYEVLERLVCSKYIMRVRRIIVGWHESLLPRKRRRSWRCSIVQDLSSTHRPSFCSDAWECFVARDTGF